jgi:hypothetical protein
MAAGLPAATTANTPPLHAKRIFADALREKMVRREQYAQ